MVDKMVGRGDVSPRPYLKAVREKELVKIDFDMDLQESILIYCRRGKELEFELLAEINKPPFLDTRPNLTEYSETREYKALFSSNGEPLGDPDHLKIRTKGRFRFF